MKALVCEMCNSNDIVKQDDYFVCQNCGTKYVVEEVRKIKTEVPAVIDKTVKVDNYYKLAESAMEAGDNWEAECNCDEILDIDINHWKAWLLKGKAIARQSVLVNLRLEEVFSCFTESFDNAPEECIDDLRVDISNEVEKFTIVIMGFCFDEFSDDPSNYNRIVLTKIKEKIDTVIPCSVDLLLKCGVKADGYKKTIADKINASVVIAWNGSISEEYYEDRHPDFLNYRNLVSCASSCIDITQALIDLCDKNDEANIQKYKNMIGYTQAIIDACAWKRDSEGGDYHVDQETMLKQEAITLYIDNIMRYHYKIKEIDPNYVVPERPKPKQKQSGCYIATCIYGSYDCPQVWTLRRFRDFTLAKTWYGRAFIKIYYTVSPTLVKLFGNTKWFKRLWKGNLDRLIKSLKEKGFEDTAYYDR